MELKRNNAVIIPEDILPLLDDLAHGDSLDENVRISIAISLFVAKSVSLARSAEIANLSLNDFIYTLKLKNIPWGEYTDEDKKEDEIALKDLLKEYKND
ncbi:MAG: putative HTH domain antitoxin [Clostridium sp.]|jgi:predicted HTH domain antitoxin